jgi:hypothetical protein
VFSEVHATLAKMFKKRRTRHSKFIPNSSLAVRLGAVGSTSEYFLPK